jgi:signal transduction histidine kinase
LQEKVQKEAIRRRVLTQKAKLLKGQNEELTKLNATKNEFIALTSHQLRTPATGVKQYIAMLMQGYAGPVTPEQEQFLERAYESNERQLHIIEDILRVAKVDMGKTQMYKKPTDIARLVENILEEQADRFTKRNQTLITKLPLKPLEADVDVGQLHMAIGNIVDNASKYTPEGKGIAVRLRQVGRNRLELAIEDEGVGVAKDDLEKLFQKFSRIPNPLSIAVGGTGLGLYWTKRIIELHDGTINVRSQRGKGTTFTISLPLQ